MPNTQSIPKNLRPDLMRAVHAFGTPPARSAVKDIFKAALFLVSATINSDTAAYSPTGEVTGAGYTAGGVAVTNAVEPATTGGTGVIAFWTPSANISYGTVTLTTSFDCVLIYNDTAAGKNAVSVNTFGPTIVTASAFTLTMPTNDLTSGLLRIN